MELTRRGQAVREPEERTEEGDRRREEAVEGEAS
jgi:hypothetical protein